ncbi:hypothetical protein HPB52_019241 [Rhipicephalus sanguineus]|uniref:EB domain-containing protein n=1 Tax=Rhipicephalus sanguineus TaxID=34632 RepID=A0A9D4PQ59_RHISA|nr:hypothetical protein HPB52_019241 [Rhipicephalus sanguineus]
MTTVSANVDWPHTEINGYGAAFLGKRCLNTSDCASKFIEGLTCNADDDGEPGNCTCPDYTPLFLEEGGIYKCSRAGALGSSCERVEQCRYNNVYLLCLMGKCICPSPMRVKQGFKCMPAADVKVEGNAHGTSYFSEECRDSVIAANEIAQTKAERDGWCFKVIRGCARSTAIVNYDQVPAALRALSCPQLTHSDGE